MPPPLREPRASLSPVTVGQHRALGILTACALLAFVRVTLPVGMGLLLGTLVAFSLEPLHQRLVRLGLRPALSAIGLSSIATLSVAGALVALGAALAQRGAELVAALRQTDGSSWVRFQALERRLLPLGVDLDAVHAKARDLASDAAARAAGSLATVATMTLDGLLALLFLALTTFFVLRRWAALAVRAELLSPLHPLHTRVLFGEFRSAGRSILLGTIVTGVAQGGLAAIGYAIFGVPHALLFGALTAVAALLPAVGTMLVWIPASGYLMATQRVSAGIGLLVFSLVAVIGFCDYFLRPRLIGRGEEPLPTLITFIALFGGVEVFGVVGLVLGPVIASLAVALLRTYERDSMRVRLVEEGLPEDAERLASSAAARADRRGAEHAGTAPSAGTPRA